MATTKTPVLRTAAPFLPVGLALFCIQLDFFSLNLALPTIAEDLDTPVTDLQWLVSGYMIALGSLLVPAGRFGDVVGRRSILLLGVAIFGLSSLTCGLASSVDLLIAARVVQGVGAALILPTAFALVTNATTEEERPRIIGILLGMAGTGTALGPVVGGVLASTAGWRWVFLLNVPVAAFAIWRGWGLADSRDNTGPSSLRSLDWWGFLTIVAGLVAISIAIDDIGVQGFASAATLGPLIAGIALLILFAWVETRATWPLVRPSLLRIRVFTILTIAGTIANVGACVFILTATLNLQDIRGLSAGESGLLFCLASIGLAICGPLSGWLSVRFPVVAVMACALLLGGPCLVILAFVTPLWLYVVVLALCGITTGMGYSLGQLAIQNVLPPERSAEGTGVLLTLLISVGGVAVVAATGIIESVGEGVPTDEGISIVLIGLGILILLAGVVTMAGERRSGVRRAASAIDGG